MTEWKRSLKVDVLLRIGFLVFRDLKKKPMNKNLQFTASAWFSS